MSQPANSTLNVAITRHRTEFFSKDESTVILTAIHKRITSEAKAKQGTPMPTFHSQPLFEDGALKLWCDNDHTLAWLKTVVSDISSTSNTPLVVKSQSEIQKRVPCRLEIPDEHNLFDGHTDVMSALSCQNPGMEFERWEFVSINKKSKIFWHVNLMVPEDQIRDLMNTGHLRLSIGLGAVAVELSGGFYFNNSTQKIQHYC